MSSKVKFHSEKNMQCHCGIPFLSGSNSARYTRFKIRELNFSELVVSKENNLKNYKSSRVLFCLCVATKSGSARQIRFDCIIYIGVQLRDRNYSTCTDTQIETEFLLYMAVLFF